MYIKNIQNIELPQKINTEKTNSQKAFTKIGFNYGFKKLDSIFHPSQQYSNNLRSQSVTEKARKGQIQKNILARRNSNIIVDQMNESVPYLEIRGQSKQKDKTLFNMQTASIFLNGKSDFQIQQRMPQIVKQNNNFIEDPLLKQDKIPLIINPALKESKISQIFNNVKQNAQSFEYGGLYQNKLSVDGISKDQIYLLKQSMQIKAMQSELSSYQKDQTQISRENQKAQIFQRQYGSLAVNQDNIIKDFPTQQQKAYGNYQSQINQTKGNPNQYYNTFFKPLNTKNIEHRSHSQKPETDDLKLKTQTQLTYKSPNDKNKQLILNQRYQGLKSFEKSYKKGQMMKEEKNKYKLLGQNNIKINHYLKTNSHVDIDDHQSVFEHSKIQQIKEKKIGSESLQNEKKKIIYTEPSSEINSLRKQNFLQKQNIQIVDEYKTMDNTYNNYYSSQKEVFPKSKQQSSSQTVLKKQSSPSHHMVYRNKNDSQDDSVIMNISAQRIDISKDQIKFNNIQSAQEKNVEYGMDTSIKHHKSKNVENEEEKLTVQMKKKLIQTPALKKSEKPLWRKGIKSSLEQRDSPPQTMQKSLQINKQMKLISQRLNSSTQIEKQRLSKQHEVNRKQRQNDKSNNQSLILLNIQTQNDKQRNKVIDSQVKNKNNQTLKTVDDQYFQADSDDEYEYVKREASRVKNVTGYKNHSEIFFNQRNSQDINLLNKSNVVTQKQETDKADLRQSRFLKLNEIATPLLRKEDLTQGKKVNEKEQQEQKEKQKFEDQNENLRKIQNVKDVLSQLRNQNFNANGDPESDEEVQLIQKKQQDNNEFILLDKMSNRVKLSNNDVNKVIDQLNSLMNRQLMSGGDDVLKSDFIEKLLQEFDFDPKSQNIYEIDTSVILNKTNFQIKNLNHLLMKLVAVQQDSITILKQQQQNFLMIDRVPVFLEVNASGMPYPAKIVLRADPKKNFSNINYLNGAIQNNMKVYLSTKTKNPGPKNYQVKFEQKVPRVFSFAPLWENSGKSDEKKDHFGSIYIGVQYDLTELKVEDLLSQNKNQKQTDTKDLNLKAILEEIAQVQMQIFISFPKDKEELQKKKMEAMLKKLQKADGQQQQVFDFTSAKGEQKMMEINRELIAYYKNQKNLQTQEKEMKSRRIHEPRTANPHSSRLDTSIYYSQINEKLSQNSREPSPTEMIDFKTAQAYNQEGVQSNEIFSSKYNQLLDMYALKYNQFFEFNDQEEEDKAGNQAEEHGYDAMQAEKYGMYDTVMNGQVLQFGKIDHIARNVFFSSKYKNMSGIRSQLNLDLLNTRLFNNLKRAEIINNQKRIKSMKSLSKWDEFRFIKGKYVEKAIKILKNRRRIINLISLILNLKVSKILQSQLQKKTIQKKIDQSKQLIALRGAFLFRYNFMKKMGKSDGTRRKNNVRQSLTYLQTLVQDKYQERAEFILHQTLIFTSVKYNFKEKVESFCRKVQIIDNAMKKLFLMKQIKFQYAMMRLYFSKIQIQLYYQNQPSKHKTASKISHRLSEFDINSTDLRTPLLVLMKQKLNLPQQQENEKSETQQISILNEVHSNIKLFIKLQKKKFTLNLQNLAYQQYEVLLKLLNGDQNKFNNEIQDKMIALFSKINRRQNEIELLEQELNDDQIQNEKNNAIQAQIFNNPKQSKEKYASQLQKILDIDSSYKVLYTDSIQEKLQEAFTKIYGLNKKKQTHSPVEEIQNQTQDANSHAVPKKGGKKDKSHGSTLGSDGILDPQKLKEERKTAYSMMQKISKQIQTMYTQSLEKEKEKEKEKQKQGRLKQEKIQQVQYKKQNIEKKQYIALTQKEKSMLSESVYEDFLNEIESKGLHRYENQLIFKQIELFKIIFKISRVHEVISGQASNINESSKDQKNKK